MRLTRTIKDTCEYGEKTTIETYDVDLSEIILAKEALKLLEERKVHEFGINSNFENRNKGKILEEPSAQEILDMIACTNSELTPLGVKSEGLSSRRIK